MSTEEKQITALLNTGATPEQVAQALPNTDLAYVESISIQQTTVSKGEDKVVSATDRQHDRIESRALQIVEDSLDDIELQLQEEDTHLRDKTAAIKVLMTISAGDCRKKADEANDNADIVTKRIDLVLKQSREAHKKNIAQLEAETQTQTQTP